MKLFGLHILIICPLKHALEISCQFCYMWWCTPLRWYFFGLDCEECPPMALQILQISLMAPWLCCLDEDDSSLPIGQNFEIGWNHTSMCHMYIHTCIHHHTSMQTWSIHTSLSTYAHVHMIYCIYIYILYVWNKTSTKTKNVANHHFSPNIAIDWRPIPQVWTTPHRIVVSLPIYASIYTYVYIYISVPLCLLFYRFVVF